MGTGLNIGGGAELSEDSEGDTGSFITDGSADPIMWAPLVRYRGLFRLLNARGVPFTSLVFACL